MQIQEANNLIQGLLSMYERLKTEKGDRDSLLETSSASSASFGTPDLEESLACLAYLKDEAVRTSSNDSRRIVKS